MIDRKELVAILKKVEPGLSAKDLIPVLTNFCFTPDSVYAYDDVVALRFPAKLGIVGGVQGRLFLDLLDANSAKEVELVQDGKTLRVKAGRSKFEFPVTDKEDFLFQSPDMNKAHELPTDDEFISALGRAALSLGRDTSVDWRYGVTVSMHGKDIAFYASDNKTACRVVLGKPNRKDDAVILPPRFVELLLDKSKTDPVTALYATTHWAQAKFTSGLKLFTKSSLSADSTGADLEKFAELFGDADKVKEDQQDLPKGFEHALEQASKVIPFMTKNPYTQLTVEENRLKVRTQSPAGDVNDTLDFKHDAAEALIAPDLLLRALPHVKTMAIHEHYLVMRGAHGMTYIVGSVQNEDDKPVKEEEEETKGSRKRLED